MKQQAGFLARLSRLLTVDMTYRSRHLARGEPLPPLKKDTWRVYNMRFCPFAQRTRMLMILKNIPFETVNVNLKRKPMWLFERNPIGLVPVIERNDVVVYESTLCNNYIEKMYPEPSMTSHLPPGDLHAQILESMKMERFGLVTRALYHVGKPSEEGERARKIVGRTLDSMEQELSADYFGGRRPGLMDVHVWPWFERFPAVYAMSGYDLVPADRYPKLTQWIQKMLTLNAVKQTMEPTELHMYFMLSLMQGDPQYDVQHTANL